MSTYPKMIVLIYIYTCTHAQTHTEVLQYMNQYKVYVHARHPVPIYVKSVANANQWTQLLIKIKQNKVQYCYNSQKMDHILASVF